MCGRRGPTAIMMTAPEVPGFDRPALVVWAREDRVMPLDHGRRLAELLRHGGWSRSKAATHSFHWTTGRLAKIIREFTSTSGPA